MFIYKITNTINNKIYIGQTIVSINKRFVGHCTTKSKTYISLAIRKHGKDNFTIEQIDLATTLEELNEKEQYWISFYNSTDRKIGYNIKAGGGNHAHSESTKARMREIKANTSNETRKRMSESSKNKVVSIETREKMSIIMTGRVRTSEHCKKLSESQKGKIVTEETKRKMREAKRKTGADRKPMSEETKRKISEKLKGLKRSDKFKRDCSIRMTGKKLRKRAVSGK